MKSDEPLELSKQQMKTFVDGYLYALENSPRRGFVTKESAKSTMQHALQEFESVLYESPNRNAGVGVGTSIEDQEQTTKITIVTEALRARASVTMPTLPKISVNPLTGKVSIQYSATTSERSKI